MAIYKSSFNKKPEKEKKEKQVKVKPEKEKRVKEKQVKTKTHFKVNKPLVLLIVFSLLFLVCVLPNNFLKNVILGLFGLMTYPICIIVIAISAFYLSKKKIEAKPRYIAYLVTAITIICLIFHLILTSRLSTESYGVFLAETYSAKTTAGGLLFSLITYPLVKLLTTVGAYILLGIALAIFIGLIIDYILVDRAVGHPKKSKFDFKNIEDFEIESDETVKITPEEKQKQIAKRKLGLESSESTIISSSMPNYSTGNKSVESRPMSKREYILTPIEPVIPPENPDDIFLDNTTGYYNSKRVQENLNRLNSNSEKEHFSQTITNSETNNSFSNEIKSNIQESAIKDDKSTPFEIKPREDAVKIEEPKQEKSYNIFDELGSGAVDAGDARTEEYYDDEQDEYDDMFEENTDDYSEIPHTDAYEDSDYSNNTEEDYSRTDEQTEETDKNESEELENIDENYSGEVNETETVDANINSGEKHEFIDEYAYVPHDDNLGSTVDSEVVRPSIDLSKFHLPNQIKKPLNEPEQMKIEEPKEKKEIPPYVAPPVELLKYMENVKQISDEELQDNIDRLEQVLEDFKVPAKVNNVTVGPAVTRYELSMPRGISVNKIAQMADDIAMTLASNGAIRVEAPIPGKNLVGIEVPNAQVSPVSLRELIDSNEFRVRGNPLSFVLGKDINGDIIFCNLDKMPHMLVAGSTGSGKSVCLNTMLLSLCYKSGPQDLRLILVDPKMVEFSTYNGLPHLLIPEVITNKDMAINALEWAIKEMERRYSVFAKNHVVNINEYNKLEMVRSKREEKMPFIVIVVDELADLMLEAKREIEDKIAKLAAKARAAGIHLVLATQRPSVDVITGTVKANLPSRIAFALTNYMDSKTVLDGGGAEKLLGKGDMLFKPQDKPEPRRIQGAFVSNEEIAKVVQFIKDHNKPVYDDDTEEAIRNPHNSGEGSHDGGEVRSQEFDPVLKDALRMFIQAKQASSSMIARRYSVGWNRAGRIIDQMERAGFIGPQVGSKPRTVLITMDEYNAIFGGDDN